MRKLAIFSGLIVILAFILWWRLPGPRTTDSNPPAGPVQTGVSVGPEPGKDAPQANNPPENQPRDEVDVFGVVRDESKNPINGAEVKAIQGSDPHRGSVISTSTLKDGTYSLSGLHFPSASPYRVFASAEGYAPATSNPFLMNNPPKRIDLTLTKGALLSGRVTDESQGAIPGATLRLFKGAKMSAVRHKEAQTDDDGVYVFESLPPDEYWLGASAKRYLNQERHFTITSHKRRLKQDFLLEYAGEGHFSGVVLDEYDQPVEGVRVEGAQNYLGASLTEVVYQICDSSADGSFLLEGFVPRGSDGNELPISVSASKEGYETGRAKVYAGNEDVRIRLRRKDDLPGSISGRVVEEDSSIPITDFRVEVLLRDSLFASRRFQSSTGEFLFSDIDEGYYDLHFSAPNRASHVRKGLSVKYGKETSLGAIGLSRGATITGMVREKGTLEPLSGAMVYVRDRKNSLHTRILAGASTDETGSYRIEGAPPGSQYVLASHPDYATAISPKLEVVEGEEYSNIVLILGDGGSIDGSILDNGIPLKGQEIRLSPTPCSELPLTSRPLDSTIIFQADERGYYRRDKLMPGHYWFFALLPTRRADVTDGTTQVSEIVEIIEGKTTTYNIDLCEGGSISGYVYSEKPLPPEVTGIKLELLHHRILADGSESNPPAQITKAGESSPFYYGNVEYTRWPFSFDDICPGEYSIISYFEYETSPGATTRGVSCASDKPGLLTVEEGKTIECKLLLSYE